MSKRTLTAADHRELARALRRIAIEKMNRQARQKLMLQAIEHEATAEELDRLQHED